MAKARGNKLIPPANYSRNPMSFNPQNQDVLSRASAALDAIRQDRLAPQFGGAQGYAAPGQNAGVSGSSPIPSLITKGLNAASAGLNFAQDNFESYSRGRRSLPSVPNAQRAGYAAPGQNAGIGGSAPQFLQTLAALAQRAGAAGQTAINTYNSSDRQSPMFGGAQGYAAPGQNAFNGPATPAIRNPINQELAPVRDPQAAAMDALRARIDAMTLQSQQANPMAPSAPVNPMQQGIDLGNTQASIMMTPGAGSSLGAARNFRRIQPESLNATTAGTVNSYNGNLEYATNPMRLDPETKFNLANANARRMVGGGAASDPTNLGGRFGGAYGSNLEADATAIAEGRAVRTADGNVVYHTGTPESARAAYLSARQNNYGRTPEQERARSALAQQKEAERAARHQAFKDATGGMNYKQYDRLQRQNALTMKAVDEGRLSPEAAMFRMQTRADKALRRSGNPMAMGVANTGRLFPDLMAGRGGQGPAQAPQNPMARTFSSMTKDSAPSADSLEAATSLAVATVNGVTGPDGSVVRPPSAFAKQLKDRGYSPEDDPGMALPNIHVYETIQSGNKLNPSDVRDLRNIAFSSRERTKNDTEWWGGKKAPFSNIGAGPFQNNPEYQKEVQDLYNALADMPEDAPDAQYEKWASDMQDLVKRWRL